MNYSFRKLKSFSLFILFFFLAMTLHAQNAAPPVTGKIKGVIKDSVFGTMVEYATIAIYRVEGNKIITGTTSGTDGAFMLDKISAGTYRIVIDFIGYNRKTIEPVKITGSSAVNLGFILLSPSVTTLKDVSVTAQRSIIENKIDKLVYNAENDITSQSGVATDVLKKVPQVTVDINGNVELQGNSNIRFLIDGKPSTAFGNNIADVLQSIPASRIQSIEVVTSPGSKYDAEGTGGIINIVLKKTTINGISGNTSLSAGTRLENGSFNLNARSGKVGFNVYLSGNAQLPSTTLNLMDRWSNDSVSQTHMTQDGRSDFKRYGFQSGLGFDWNISQQDNITLSFNYNYNGSNTNSLTNQQLITFDTTGKQISNEADILTSKNDYSSQTYDWSVNYKHNFQRKGHDLNFLYTSSYSKNFASYIQSQELANPDSILSGSKGTNPGNNRETDLSLDYSLPLGEKASLEMGGKTVLYELNSTTNAFSFVPFYNEYLPDNLQSYTLKYNRNIYAGYLSGSFSLFHWLDLKLGLRYEYTQTKIVYVNNPNVDIPDYNTFAPSVVLMHSFKNNQVLKFSYSYRIQRPDYRDLNPFINLSDPHNITTGNPGLTPELVNGFELSYSKTFPKGGNINVVTFYRRNIDDIQSFVTYYPAYKIGDSVYTDVTVTNRENISLEQRGGLNLYGSFTLVKGLNLRSNISVYDRYIVNTNGGNSTINSFEYRINLNLTYQLPWDLAFEFFGNFNSPRTGVQGTVPSFTTYSLAVRKQFLKKKASIALTATNPFGEYINQKTNLSGDNFTLSTVRQVPYRSFGINFTFKFGNVKFKPKDEEHNDVPGPPEF